ncbi:hypothetical protein BLNAU_8775 [Blattamonas nauphoetae]|uniref:Uncharacterized protein n=1 Tax=Blattamonas nauphoetae TaxID=2049346 RepID=A0ABQ9XXK7_9EUKA|nr:hypothetical protein BLNAU_8775 [Blattamonas nauphoetae]
MFNSAYSFTGTEQSSGTDIETLFRQSKSLRGGIDQGLDSLSRLPPSNDWRDIINQISSDIKDLSHLCEKIGVTIQTLPEPEKAPHTVRLNELRRVCEDQRTWLRNYQQKARIQEEQDNLKRLISSGSGGPDDVSNRNHSSLDERARIRMMDKQINELLNQATTTLDGIREDTSTIHGFSGKIAGFMQRVGVSRELINGMFRTIGGDKGIVAIGVILILCLFIFLLYWRNRKKD